MMVMTAKVDFKKIAIGLIAAIGVIVAILMLFGGGGEAAPTAAPAISNNDARVKFLTDQGWQVNASPVESGQVRIPTEQSQIYEQYNALQKSQGYDLSPYGGKAVMRYVYKVTNFPGSTQPVYATLLVYKNQIIGGDITDTSAKGVIRGLLQSGTEPQVTLPASSGEPVTQEEAAETVPPTAGETVPKGSAGV